MKANEFWLNKIKRDGIRLVVEIDLSFDEFRKMMERSLGYELSDDEVYSLWEIANRRILPPDSGSFSGIGSDVGECVRRDIATDQLASVLSPSHNQHMAMEGLSVFQKVAIFVALVAGLIVGCSLPSWLFYFMGVPT